MRHSAVMVTIMLILLVMGAILCAAPVLHEMSVLAAQSSTPWLEAAELGSQAWWAVATGSPDRDLGQGRAMLEDVLARWREVGHPLGVAHTLAVLGDVALEQGDVVAAETYLQESLSLARELGRPLNVAQALSRLGRVAEARGDNALARAHHEQALAVYRQLGSYIAPTLEHLGAVAARQQDWAAAQDFFQEALQRCEGPRDDALRAQCLTGLAQVAAAQGHAARAAELRREAERLRPASGVASTASPPAPPNQTPPPPAAVLLDEEVMAPAPRRDP